MIDYCPAQCVLDAREPRAAELVGNWFASTSDAATGLTVETIVGLRADGSYSLLQCNFAGDRLEGAFAGQGTYAMSSGRTLSFRDASGVEFSEGVEAVRDAGGAMTHCLINGARWSRCAYAPEWLLSAQGMAVSGVLKDLACEMGPAMLRTAIRTVVSTLNDLAAAAGRGEAPTLLALRGAAGA